MSFPVLLYPFQNRDTRPTKNIQEAVTHWIYPGKQQCYLLKSLIFLLILNIQSAAFLFFFFFHYHWTLMWLIHRTAYYKHQLIPSWVRKSIQSSSLYAKLGLLFFPLCSTLYLLPPNFTCCFTIKSLSSMMCHCNSSTSSLIITISYSIIGVFGLPRCITQHHHTWAVFPLGEFGQLSISMTTFYCKQQ